MDTTQEPVTVVSLCSGYGGLELGVRGAISALRTLAYVEIEAFACANLVAKMEKGLMDVAPIWTNLKTFDGRPFYQKVDILMGGYPCQPFSAAGKRLGAEDPRHLWPHIREHIQTIEPKLCFFENVEGHLSLGFREVKHQLEELGYCVEAGLFSASEVGAPHQRKRLFILAHAKSANGRSSLGRIRYEAFREPCSRGVRATSIELGNTEHNGLYGRAIDRSSEPTIHDESEGQNSSGEFEGTGEPPELADTYREGLEGYRDSPKRDEKAQPLSWPTGPSEQQHEWEAPRTTQPPMGRTADGANSWVDELRLLGNGVVPATAELAFRTLLGRLIELEDL